MKLDSICVHGAKDKNNTTGALAVPIYQSATFAHPGVGQSTGYDYARVQNPTREALERLVAALEGGTEAMAFASGMAAIDALLSLFEPGDHIICTDDLYGGSVRLFSSISKRTGIVFNYVDSSDPKIVANALSPKTRAIFLETPSNPMMKITDIASIRSLIDPKILLIVDNTFLTPYFQKPLALGADLVLHSGTKYLSGHNDTLSGFLITNNTDYAEKIRYITKTVGTGLAPFDSFLMIRGLKTLALRMEKSQANAKAIAVWLKDQPKVTSINYPGLPESLGFSISQKQATGFGSMLSFSVDSEETAKRVLEEVKMILYAESLGGTETLITYPILQTHSDVPPEIRQALGIDEKLLRLSVGIENQTDILEDLAQALA